MNLIVINCFPGLSGYSGPSDSEYFMTALVMLFASVLLIFLHNKVGLKFKPLRLDNNRLIYRKKAEVKNEKIDLLPLDLMESVTVNRPSLTLRFIVIVMLIVILVVPGYKFL